MQPPPLDPPIDDVAPTAAILTSYDERHAITYLRLLDAEADGADWREVARIVLHIDPEHEPDRARRVWESHLARARWMTEKGTGTFSKAARPTEIGSLHVRQRALPIRSVSRCHCSVHPGYRAVPQGPGGRRHRPWPAPIGDQRAPTRTCGPSMRPPMPMSFYAATQTSWLITPA